VVRTNKRLAFTMIELIFAIVIISIAVVSLPVMTKITEKGIEESILQEAIFAASAELMGVSTGYWDERSMDDIDVSYMSRVINITTGVNDCNTSTHLRPGHIAQPLHRRCLYASPAQAALDKALDANITSLDDFDTAGVDVNLTITTVGNSTERQGYKNIYTSVIDVNRTNNSYIKTITSIIKISGEKKVKLSMQSANIGEIDYYKRRF